MELAEDSVVEANPVHPIEPATSAMTDDTRPPFSFPAVRGKKLSAAFDGGRVSSDGGVMLLAAAARRMRIAEKLAAVIPNRRDPSRVVHPLCEILLARMLAIACGYEDPDDLDSLRTDPAFKLACGRLPESGADLMSQPTVSRRENAQTLRDLVRLGRVRVDLYCTSYSTPPEAVVLDIDDTVDVVHGHQQLSLFNAHYDERCFLPIHVYDTATGPPVAMILRPGKTPSGTEVRGHVRRLVRAIRRHWPTTRITIRGDCHYCRPGVMDWCEAHGVDYIFGLTGTKALAAKVEEVADDICVERAIEDKDAVRGFAETTHAAKSWTKERRVSGRIEVTRLGLDIRYVVTNIASGTAEWLYAELYCARGQAENLIKLHKAQLAPDRTSCRAATANQMRLVLHAAAYWLILAVRDAIPKAHALAEAEFNTIRLRLLKVAARVTETASRVRVAFASACPDAVLFRLLASPIGPAVP